MNKIVYVIIGCDTDPDRVGFLDNVPKDGLSWRGMLHGIPQTKNRIQEIKDSDEKSPRITWCLRADHQIRTIYGSYNFILEEHKRFFIDLESSGDELGWHPHFFKFCKETGLWYQEFNNIDWQLKMLEEASLEFKQSLPGRANSVRTGWIYHNNKTMKKLEELDVKVDFSGIPGLSILPKNDIVKSVNFYDWSITPNEPYFPSLKDYRRKALDNEQQLEILEAPNFAATSLFWSTASGLVLAKKMKDIKPFFKSFKRKSYWTSITTTPKYFQPVVNSLLKEISKKDKIFFVNYFHPDELLLNKSTLYSLDNLYNNLQTVRESVLKSGAELKFITASEIINHLD